MLIGSLVVGDGNGVPDRLGAVEILLAVKAGEFAKFATLERDGFATAPAGFGWQGSVGVFADNAAPNGFV